MQNVLDWSGILLLCIVCIGFISTLIIIVITAKMRGCDRFAKVLKGLVIGSIVYVLLNSFITARIHLHYICNNLETKQSMALINTGNMITVKSSEEIRAFLNILKESETISPHHSHPMNEILLRLPENEAIYKLGKDSSAADEYWLNIKNGGVESTMLHFKSTVLKEWLRRNGIEY